MSKDKKNYEFQEYKNSREPCAEETLRVCLVQACENARAYMDLRFKHFGTFVVLIGILAASFSVNLSIDIRITVAAFGIMLTVFFWLLDFRTNQLFKNEVVRIRAFKDFLRVPVIPVLSRKVFLGASKVTNMIFATIFCCWLIFECVLVLLRTK